MSAGANEEGQDKDQLPITTIKVQGFIPADWCGDNNDLETHLVSQAFIWYFACNVTF